MKKWEKWIDDLSTGDKVIVVTRRIALPDLKEVCRIVKTSANFITVAYGDKQIRFIRFSKECQRETEVTDKWTSGRNFIQWTQEAEDLILERKEKDKKIWFIRMFMNRKFTGDELLQIYSCMTPEVMKIGKEIVDK